MSGSSLARELAAPLAALDTLVRAHRVDGLVPARVARFLADWGPSLARAQRVAGTPGLAATAFAIADAVPALDDLAFALRRSRRLVELRDPLEELRAILHRSLVEGVRLVPALVDSPRDRATLEDDLRRAGAPPDAVAVEVVPSFAREGTIVAIERRGVLEGRAVAAPARVHVSSGGARTVRLELLEAALVALEAAAPAREDVTRLAREIDRSETDEPVANGEAALRFALSALERAGAVDEARRATLAFLVARGISPFALAAGERFDPERHPPSSFERVLARGAPRGVVVRTAQTGFRDTNGVVLARAVVIVGD